MVAAFTKVFRGGFTLHFSGGSGGMLCYHGYRGGRGVGGYIFLALEGITTLQ